MGLVALAATVKFLLYTFWCRVGIKWLTDASGPPGGWRHALALSALRVTFGLTVGWGMVLLLSVLRPSHDRLGVHIVDLVITLLILRWFSWSLVSAVIQRRLGKVLILASGRKDTMWRFGGLCLSFLSDAGALLSGALLAQI